MEFPLRHINGHIISTIEGEDWIVDTGSPLSFGSGNLALDDGVRQISVEFMGIGAEFLSEHIGLPLKGLLGTDILNAYNVVFDLSRGVIYLGEDEAMQAGTKIPIELCLGVPVLSARLNGELMRGFFDTGAQVSYAPPRILRPEDMIGTFQDFYPTQGSFETCLHWADCELAGLTFRIRCGDLPGFLSGVMGMAGAQCIIGNEVMIERRIGYFPQRGLLVIGD